MRAGEDRPEARRNISGNGASSRAYAPTRIDEKRFDRGTENILGLRRRARHAGHLRSRARIFGNGKFTGLRCLRCELWRISAYHVGKCEVEILETRFLRLSIAFGFLGCNIIEKYWLLSLSMIQVLIFKLKI